jgi:hypothetical protein
VLRGPIAEVLGLTGINIRLSALEIKPVPEMIPRKTL